LEYPERDWAPLCPRVDVPPLPDPCPLPIRFVFFVEPCAGFRLLKSISFIFYLIDPIELLNFLNGNEVIYFCHHSEDLGCSFFLNRMMHPADTEGLQGSFLPQGPADSASDLGDSDLFHFFYPDYDFITAISR
jgi:hypothetical protein